MIITNAKLPRREGLFDITINDGIFSAIEPASPASPHKEEVVDAAGNLVSPPFVDPHVHLDAVLMSRYIRPNRSGTLLEGIEIWGDCKKKADSATYKEHARKVIEWYLAQGTMFFRTHVDTTTPGQENITAVREVADELSHLVDVQMVAFPQDGIYTYADGETDMRQAIQNGCDVVGGIPHNELSREDGVKDVEFVFELACEHGLPIDIHCDETGDPQSRFIEVMVKEALLRDYGRKTAASHVTAMHNYDNDYAFKLEGLLARSGIHIITNPFDNSFLMNRNDGYPRRRGHVRVDELHSRGVNVAIGHDSVLDPWYPLGKGSMLQAANLLLHTAHMTSYEQIDILFDMITTKSAEAMGIGDLYGIDIGKPGSLIILDAADQFEAIRLMADPLFVIRKGRIVSRTTPKTYKVNTGIEEGSQPHAITLRLD